MKPFSYYYWIVVACLTGAALVASAQTVPAASDAAPATPVAADTDDVEVSATPALAAPTGVAVSATPAPAAPTLEQRASALEQHNAELEARLQALESAQAAATAATAGAVHKPVSAPAPTSHADESALGLHATGYVQAQYESSQYSQDQLQPGGASLNRDRFVVRRARLHLSQAWKYAELDLELDSNTNRGVNVGVRRASAALLWPADTEGDVPYAKLTLGLQELPFGYELPFGARGRVFMERSQASVAFFPGETDVGGTVSGGVGPIRYALGLFNGQPADGSTFAAADPNAAKDLMLRIGVDLKPREDVTFAGGVSFLSGKGFHAGSDPSKNGIAWKDVNEDSVVQTATEVTAVPGTVAERSRNFRRWAAAADARLGVHSKAGWSRLYGEVTLASNLDRGVFVADPYALSNSARTDTRELGYYVAFVQEVTAYGLVGIRTDFYDGNSDFVEQRRGQVVPGNRSLRTYSPLLGLVLPDRARLILQYDIIQDSLARDSRGVPTDLRNNQWTLRLQVGI